ncbi:MAG: hypothetical protein MMC33_003526 [Icmadophila ericetorum]|nr:hypothetical protein [Icmadophila ericetorum]
MPNTSAQVEENSPSPANLPLSPTPNQKASSSSPSPPRTSEPNEAEIQKAKKITNQITHLEKAILHSKISTLTKQIAETQAQISKIVPQLKNPNPAKTVKQHIHLLHAYNDIRDVGMGLLGIVAENRGVRIRDVYEDFGVSGDD